MSATLRQAARHDVSDLFRIRYAVLENRPTSQVVSASQVIEALEVTGRGWVIESDGAIVAFAVGTAHNGNLWGLFVDPAYQGLGHGRRLHDTVVEWLWSRGLDRIWLNTQPGTRAQHFYERLGWVSRGLMDSGQLRFELSRHDPKA
jgi:GNAT superfamily N-acetyltransferase